MGGCAPHPRSLSDRERGTESNIDEQDEQDWGGIEIATWFDRLTMSGYAPGNDRLKLCSSQ